jgi:tetratricopeptide (TPR) repeat protein
MPLGLELAAAWLRVLSCQGIVQEIEKNLAFLTSSFRDMPVRHRSLAAVFDHSWKLLSAEEQRIFQGLAVFRGGFWREAAEKVAGATLPLLSALVDKSFLRRNASGRYEIHELLRQYGAEKLAEAGERDQLRDRHLVFFLELAEEAEPHLRGADQATWLDRLELERDNLRAVLEWSRTARDRLELGLRLAGLLESFWLLRGYFLEGREYLSAALSGPETLGRTEVRANALGIAGNLAFMMSDYPATRAFLEESLSIYRELGPASRHGLAHTLIKFGDMETQMGNYMMGSSLLKEALGITRELEDVRGIATALWQLGSWAVHPGDYEQAVQYFEEALPLLRQLGDKWFTAIVLSGLGEVALRQGDYERATALEEEALVLRREIQDKWGIAVSSGNFAWIALRQGNLKGAVTLLAESLALRREIGDIGGSAWCLEKLAEIALTKGQRASASRRAEDFQRAARLFGAAAALRKPLGSVIDLVDQPEYERQLALLRAQLDEAAFATAWTEGQAMTLEQAIEEALAVELIS